VESCVTTIDKLHDSAAPPSQSLPVALIHRARIEVQDAVSTIDGWTQYFSSSQNVNSTEISSSTMFFHHTGLNFQIEHHLFPKICHIHYAALAPLVEQTCQEFGVRYKTNETFQAALGSHFRWLRKLGTPDTAT
jgi:Fatty acid desaturase